MGQPNMNQMMKQVQKMQADMAKAQEELKNEVVEASAGGGMVTVKISGELELKELLIDPEAVDPEDVEMLQDMVQAAVNEAIRAAQELAASKMNAAAGGLAGPIIQYEFAPEGGALAAKVPLTVPAGVLPSDAAVSPDGKSVYVVNGNS